MISEEKAHIVAVDIGYGHQRTAYPLKSFALGGEVINANSYQGIDNQDKKIWLSSRNFYEFISKFKRFPVIGGPIFSFYDKFQNIPAYYPKRDLSKPSFSLKRIYYLIKKGWGKDLIEKLKIRNKKLKIDLPLISTFFVPAFMAEVFDYPADIFCVVCDADISRTWAPLIPAKSRIRYLVPNFWAANRLKLYGVREKNIFFSGYPLPRENIGSEKMDILKHDLARRILNLDPAGVYRRKYKPLLKEKIEPLPERPDHILTIMFSIGGAGAQKETVGQYLKSLTKKIREEKIKLILSAGIREKVKEYFWKKIRELKLEKFLGSNIEIIFKKNINDYFSAFNRRLREADILWTKPSELSFYSALGIPIIIAPPIGSQEDFNKKWLLHMGSGILEENPKYANQWIFDFLESGRLAEAALQGFIKEEKLGVFNIKKICFG
jgi:hypothetical protein